MKDNSFTLPHSHWLQGLDLPEAPSSEGRRSEVIIIGGGYAGLSAAISLAQAGKQVTVLEQFYCGYGASGRNAGHLTPTIGKDIPSLLMIYGKDRTKELIRIAEESVHFTEEVMREHNIHADYLNSGNIMAAVTTGHLNRLRKSFNKMGDLGLDIAFLEESDSRSIGLPPAFLGGIHEKCGGSLHPGKYLSGLIRAALALGVSIHEHVHVLSYQPGNTIRIESSRGTYEADRLILATNAFPPLNKYLRSKIAPVTVSLFETAPLTEDQMLSIGWTGREGIYTAHEILESYRLTAQNTIVGGSKTITYRGGFRDVGKASAGDMDLVLKAFKDRFPELEGLNMQSTWSGPICFTLDFLPVIRPLEDRVVTACAFAGHGLAMAGYAGHLAAEIQSGKPVQHYLVERRLLSKPPEPLLTWLVKLLVWIFQMLDNSADRKARRSGAHDSEER